jgi:hypothetical protein
MPVHRRPATHPRSLFIGSAGVAHHACPSHAGSYGQETVVSLELAQRNHIAFSFRLLWKRRPGGRVRQRE